MRGVYEDRHRQQWLPSWTNFYSFFYLFLGLPPFIFLVKWRSACKLMDLPLAAGFHSSWEILSLMSVGSWTLAFSLVKNYLKADYIWLILNKSSTGCFPWIFPWDLICVSSFEGHSPALLMLIYPLLLATYEFTVCVSVKHLQLLLLNASIGFSVVLLNASHNLNWLLNEKYHPIFNKQMYWLGSTNEHLLLSYYHWPTHSLH